MNIEDIEDSIIVVVEAPDFFKGRKLATTLGRCKWHENSIECLLLDEKVTVRKICIGFDKAGDKVIKLSDLIPTP